MKVTYKFASGEISVVEVDGEIGEAILALEKEQGLRDRAETRRHVPLSAFDVEGSWFTADDDPLARLLDAEDHDAFWRAIELLTPKQRALLHALYLSSEPMSQEEYASAHGLDISSVRQNLWRMRAALKKIWRGV